MNLNKVTNRLQITGNNNIEELSDSLSFQKLLNEALEQDFSGWDFSAITGRWKEHSTSWNYREIVSSYLADVTSLLDMGTGGGELLSTFNGLPKHTCATERYEPNIPVARKKLKPLGVKVFSYTDDNELPFKDETFELVINCHESLSANEVFRILKPGGRFITQQVGGRDNFQLNEWLQDDPVSSYEDWNLNTMTKQIKQAGFEIKAGHEEYPITQFNDIVAILYYLKAIPWQIAGFDVTSSRQRLLNLHDHIQQSGDLKVKSHRFYIECLKAI